MGEATTTCEPERGPRNISIHASRGGSDPPTSKFLIILFDFNPRFPWGKRLLGLHGSAQRRHFNPRFPWGKRHNLRAGTPAAKKFQSTLPVGEATFPDQRRGLLARHFNPRFPWGKRLSTLFFRRPAGGFQSTLPVGEATNSRKPIDI